MRRFIDMDKALSAAWFKFLKEQPDDEVRRRFKGVRRVCWMGWDKLDEAQRVDAMRIHFWQTPREWDAPNDEAALRGEEGKRG